MVQCAKQSQFPGGAGWDRAAGARGGGYCAKRSQFPGGAGWDGASGARGGAIVQNEANFRRGWVGRGLRGEGRGLLCETKPIRWRAQRGPIRRLAVPETDSPAAEG
jgi:hypothetical protein